MSQREKKRTESLCMAHPIPSKRSFPVSAPWSISSTRKKITWSISKTQTTALLSISRHVSRSQWLAIPQCNFTFLSLSFSNFLLVPSIWISNNNLRFIVACFLPFVIFYRTSTAILTTHISWTRSSYFLRLLSWKIPND